MNKQLLFSALALATLALGACSSEPSDWRPDQKVSLDTVDPGTRSDENFDQAGSAHGSMHGEATGEAGHSGMTIDPTKHADNLSAEEVRSANDPSAPLTRSEEAIQSVRRPSDTTGTKALSGPTQ